MMKIVNFSSAMNVEDSTSVPDKILSLSAPKHPAGTLSTDTATERPSSETHQGWPWLIGLGEEVQRDFLSTGGRALGPFIIGPVLCQSSKTGRSWLLIVVISPIRGQQASASGRWTYLPGQSDKSITRDWQRSTPTSDARYQYFFTNFPNMLLWYLRVVQCITGEILVDILNYLPWILCREWVFLPRIEPLQTA